MATTYNNLGLVALDQQNANSAADFLKLSLQIRLRCHNDDSEHSPDIAASYENLGLVYQAQGNLNAAADCHNKAL